MVLCDTDTAITIPNGAPTGEPHAIGLKYWVLDNMGTGGTSTITVTFPIGTTTTTASISANYGSQTLVWGGQGFSHINGP